MSATIRISYEHPEELTAILHKLQPLVKRTKLQPPKGKYKLGYLHLKPIQEEKS